MKHPTLSGKIVPLCISALRELEALPCLGLAGLLTFLLARVACQKIIFTKGVTKIAIGLQEGAGDAQLDCANLSAYTTAVGSDRDIILIRHIGGVEGMEDLVLERKRAEVVLERALVDRDLPCSGNQGYSGGSGLATAGG